jgi:hypothetical protein
MIHPKVNVTTSTFIMRRPPHTLDFSRSIPLVLSVLIRESRIEREKSRDLVRRLVIAVL